MSTYPVVQFVIDAEGIAGTYIDDPVKATKHAQKVGGVVVPIAAMEDHRTPPAGDSTTNNNSTSGL